MVRSVPGNREILPVEPRHTNPLSAQPFLIDFFAAPVPFETVAVTSNSGSLDGQVLGVTVVLEPSMRLVVPVAFQVIVPDPVPRDANGNFPPPPVFAVSSQLRESSVGARDVALELRARNSRTSRCRRRNGQSHAQ